METLAQEGAASPLDSVGGAGRYAHLSKALIKKRTALAEMVAGRLKLLLQEGEQVAYLAAATQKPSFWDSFGLGAWVYSYNQCALVLTDRRLIEILLDFGGKKPAFRTRSYEWRRISGFKLRWGTITLTSDAGEKHAWVQIPGRDRKFLNALIPKLQAQGAGYEASAGEVPAFHCSSCGAVIPEETLQCAACGTRFRDKAFATRLSLGFPGAGLWYAGRPLLGTGDFLGEVFLLAFMAWMVLGGSHLTDAQPLWTLGFVFLLSKAESVHLARFFTGRHVPEKPGSEGTWRMVMTSGVIGTALALGIPYAFAGKMQPALHHHLRLLDTEESGWSEVRDENSWDYGAEDGTKEAEWQHIDGWVMEIFAYPLGLGETVSSFRDDFQKEMRKRGEIDIKDIEVGIGHGFRTVTHLDAEDGTPYSVVQYLLYSPDQDSIHQITFGVPRNLEADASPFVEEALSLAEWEGEGTK